MIRCVPRTIAGIAFWLLCAAPAVGEQAPAAAAQADAESSLFSGWSFQAAPYLWMFFIDGDIGAGDKQTSVDSNFTDLFEHSDTVIGLEANLQARNGPWTIVLDPTWLRSTSSFGFDDGPSRVSGDVTADFVLIDALVMREVWHDPLGAPVVEKGMPRQGVALDAMGGMRATIIAGDLDLKLQPPGDLLDSVKHQWDSTQSWVDPVIGARVTAELGRFSLLARGDVGGFTVASDITSEMWASAACNFRLFGLDAFSGLAFRALYDDYDGDDGFLYKTWTYGPVIGMGFRF